MPQSRRPPAAAALRPFVRSLFFSSVRSFAVLCLLGALALAPPAAALQETPSRGPDEEPRPEGVAAETSDSPEKPAEPEPSPAATVREEIVVSASRVEEPRRRVASAVTVIGRDEIEARREPTVAELLRTVPGVEVVRGGPPGSATSVFLRGAASAHTLVLVDGVRVNSPAVGGFDWADLTTDSVERIEVLRGPQSALYGSEAIGGVVSVFTRRGAAGLDGTASAEAGSDESWRVGTSWRGGADRWDWTLAASRREVGGLSSAAESAGNDEDDPYESAAVAGTAGASFWGDGRAVAAVRWSDSELGLDGFSFLAGGPVDDPNYRQSRRALYGSVDLTKPAGPRLSHRLRLGVADEDYEATDPDTPFHPLALATRGTEATWIADLALLGRADPLAPHAGLTGLAAGLTGGVGWERREAASSGGFDESADIGSAFLEARLAAGDRFRLGAGVRHDDHSVFGAETTWRGTAWWRVARATRLHGTWGTGFRAPSFNELFFPGFGNPDLAAETSEGWDAGVEQELLAGRLVADLVYFANELDNLIGFDVATFRAENVAAAETEGLEATLEWRPSSRWTGRAAYTRTDSEDLATGLPLARRPKHRASAALVWDPPGRWDASLAAYAVRDRVESGGAPLDDYERVDLALGYELRGDLTAYLRVDNLLDDDHAELAGFTTPGAMVHLGLRWGR